MKALKADASVDVAIADFVMSPDQSEVWLTYDMAVTAASITFWNENLSGTFALIRRITSQHLCGPSLGFGTWQDESGATGGTNPSPETWRTCELHYSASTTIEFFIQGVLTYTGSPGSTLARVLVLGQEGPQDPASVVYFANVKLGTTRGASDLFADDFSSGNLDAWTTTTGDVSVIDDPFPAVNPPRLTLTPVVPTALGEIAPRWQPETAYLAGDTVFARGQFWEASEGVSGTDEPPWQDGPNAGDTVSE